MNEFDQNFLIALGYLLNNLFPREISRPYYSCITRTIKALQTSLENQNQIVSLVKAFTLYADGILFLFRLVLLFSKF